MPTLGRIYGRRPELRLFFHARQVIFYKIEAQHVLIVRVLHERMSPDRHI